MASKRKSRKSEPRQRRHANMVLDHSAQSKDAEFSRTTVNELWAEGLADVHRAVADVEWLEPLQLGHGVSVYDRTR